MHHGLPWGAWVSIGKCGCALECGMCLCRWLVGGRLVGSRGVSLSKDIISKKKTTASSLIWPNSRFSGFLTSRPMIAVSLCNLPGLGMVCRRLVRYERSNCKGNITGDTL